MKTGLKRYLLLSLAFLGFFTVLIILDDTTVEELQSEGPATPSLPVVAYQPVFAAHETLTIPVFGELRPKWDIQIKSQVNGEVDALFAALDVGARVSKGESLVKIDQTRYQALVDQARLALEQAKLELIQAQNKSKLAQSDWERSGLSSPPTDLMLFKPQLAIAE